MKKLAKKPVVELTPKGAGAIAAQMRPVLEMIGEDPSREGLIKTPERFEKAMRFITSGYRTNLDEIVNDALFTVKCDEMVVVRDIEFFSTCEHHLLPFFGKMHVAYLPKE
jgi:GTP cyclohydrolase I